MKRLKIFSLAMFLFTAGAWHAQDSSTLARTICKQTFAKTKTLKSVRYEMRKEERIGGKMQVQVSAIKLNLDPYQVYMKQISPKAGLEVLYSEGANGGKALVSPNGFPWMTLKMDPEGSIMRKDQHHTTKDAGFDLVISILEHLFKKYEADLGSMLSMSPEVIFDSQPCHKITFANAQFKLIKYRVKAAENILKIAKNYNLCSYLILEKNKDLSDYYDVKEGDEIWIPNDYSPKMELLIDKNRFIPLSIKVYDDQGLFEHYQYSGVELNPGFSDADFSEGNSEYGF